MAIRGQFVELLFPSASELRFVFFIFNINAHKWPMNFRK